MPSMVWYHSGADPFLSGELRLLGLPALMVEEPGWRCRFLPVLGARDEPADLAVISVGALDAIARTGGWPTPPIVLLSLDDAAIMRETQQLEVVLLAAGRIDVIVARGPVALRWARDNLADRVRCTMIPDIADRGAELAAAAMRFSLPREAVPPLDDRCAGFWFAGPGDLVDEAEIVFVLDAAARAAAREQPMALVAPRATLEWLYQAGLPGTTLTVPWTAAAVDRLLESGRRAVLPDTRNAARRRAKLARYGLTARDAGDVASFAPWSVAARWRDLLRESLAAPAAPRRPTHSLLLFLDLIQDVELALPIIDAALRRPALRLRVAVTTWLVEQAPRLAVELDARGIVPELVERRAIQNGGGVQLDDADALLTIVETTLNVHKRAHALTLRAQARHIPTFTLQHGLENVGLTYFDEVHDSSVDIASDFIFAWFPPEEVPVAVPLRVRPRLIHVGRPRMPAPGPLRIDTARGGRIIAVFENLHWDRYSRRFREQFIADCFQLAAALEDAVVIIKPHPAGKWLMKSRETLEPWPVNMLIADPEDPLWADATAASLIDSADAVITTPSSVAVDAVIAGKRVAIAGYELDVSAYAPLPILRGFEDWLGFATSRETGIRAAQARARFLGRIDVAGPSEERLVASIEAVLATRLIRSDA